MFAKQDKKRDGFMLNGSFADEGYDWWWHSFTAVNDATGEEKPFFIEYFTCNPELGGKDPVLGQDAYNLLTGKKPSYVMVKAGWWGSDAVQLHRYFGWENVKIHKRAPYSLEADDCFAGEYELRGSVEISSKDADEHPEWMCGSGSMEWDLKLHKMIPFNVGYGAGGFFRRLKAFAMYWHAEGMKTLYSGTVKANGVTYSVYPDRCYGYADKNWGEDFTSPWVWLSSCDLTSKLTGRRLNNSVFDIGGGCPVVFNIPLQKKLLSAFYYEGEEFEFNFSKFWTMTRTKFRCKETDDAVIWHVRQENRSALIDVKVKCLKKNMLLINYEAPNGTRKHNRLWNGGNGKGVISLYEKHNKGLYLIDEIRCGHVGCEYGVYSE
ncbi:MAG: hypothetical protein J6Y57_05665 [Lachnospiraceae bacterium]|nr:hypothetical protein [Lachnospiraceae bacterium]